MARGKPKVKSSKPKVRNSKPKVSDGLSLELDGDVFLVETTDGKTMRTALEGKLVLLALSQVIEDACESYLEKLEGSR